MTTNPYSSPVVDSLPANDSVSDANDRTLVGIARQTFLAWEGLRLIYIFILGPLTLGLTGRRIIEANMFLTVLAGGIFANICFFAGPVVETYVRWLGYEGKGVRWFLFVSGTLLTAMLAFVTIGVLTLLEK